jgi:hypothetical protein
MSKKLDAITQYYGANPSAYASINLGAGRPRLVAHEGIDIAAPVGTPVLAVARGIVSRAVREEETQSNYGTHVYLSHANGYVSIYAHLSRLNVGINQAINAGSVLGWVGSTGASTGPHLHFGLKKQGATARGETFQPYDFIDPTEFIVDYLTRTEDAQYVDVLPYLNGRIAPAYVARVYDANGNNVAEERYQYRREATDKRGWTWYVTKNVAGTEWEMWGCTGQYIRLMRDTSPTPENGVDAYYEVYSNGTLGGRWCRRIMRVGEQFVEPQTHRVTFRRISDCQDYGDSRSGVNRNRTVLFSVAGGVILIGNEKTEIHEHQRDVGRIGWVNNAATHAGDHATMRWEPTIDVGGEQNGFVPIACVR